MAKALTCLIWLAATTGALALAEMPDPGRDLYLTAGGYGCAVCHGPVANGSGQAGGPIRGATREAFEKALVEQPAMQLLVSVLSPGNIADLSRYLGSLAQIPLLELVYADSGWRVTQEAVTSGQTVQLVVVNDSFIDLSLSLPDFGFASITIAPLDTQVFEWVAVAGSFLLPDNGLFVVSVKDL